jgi:hypothetical protein
VVRDESMRAAARSCGLEATMEKKMALTCGVHKQERQKEGRGNVTAGSRPPRLVGRAVVFHFFISLFFFLLISKFFFFYFFKNKLFINKYTLNITKIL